MRHRASGSAAAAKRAFDLVVAACGIVFLAPLLAGIGAVVKADSPGPAFYRGERTGRYGKPFAILKFRSMHDGRRQHGALTTSLNDPRLTRLGQQLRTHKLDELPQLVNVLFGDMSLVGPRPEMPAYTRLYSAEEQVILQVRPGITDYASLEFRHLNQVVGASSDPDRTYLERVWPRKMRLRIEYATSASLADDVRILCRTVGALFR